MTPKPNYKTAEHGYLYCLNNESQPTLVKIGMTANDKKPHQRAKEISSTTAIATPFRVEFAKQVRHPYQKEQELHHLLQTKGMRVNHKKEHFRMTPYEALQYFYLIEGEWDPAPSPYLMRPSRPIYGRPPLSRPLSPIVQKRTEQEQSLIRNTQSLPPHYLPLASQQQRDRCASWGLLVLLLAIGFILYWVLSS